MISIICRPISRFPSARIIGVVLALIYLASAFVGPAIAAEPLKVIVPPWSKDGSSQNVYCVKLLTLAFSKTEATDGAVQIQFYPEYLTGTRFFADLKHNKTIDVLWHGTNLEREHDLIAIPISLTKELNEYRILLIRKEDQEKFSKVKSVADLRKFTAGSGTDWPSRNILQHNDLPVMAVANTTLLLIMLKMKRFDYMSRNMFEIWEEAEHYAKDDLVIEKTLLLHGGVPYYFFVSKANPKLAERIERGLRMAIADGDFEKLFLSNEYFNRGVAELAKNKRLMLDLDTNVSMPH
jgi:ABC-type amino acid transport substrate-binding protein